MIYTLLIWNFFLILKFKVLLSEFRISLLKDKNHLTYLIPDFRSPSASQLIDQHHITEEVLFCLALQSVINNISNEKNFWEYQFHYSLKIFIKISMKQRLIDIFLFIVNSCILDIFQKRWKTETYKPLGKQILI